jgi:L-rhamnose mutarotase
MKITRYGSVTRLNPEGYENYKRLHANIWTDVAEMIRKSHIQNYSIYYRDGQLFSYFEYTGDDFEADMATIAADESTQKWWQACTPNFNPYVPGELWAPMEEVFYQA